jgi:hypothetical protein
MPLEAATYVNDLVITNPASGDQRSEGDDHLRLVKTVLKATLPGLAGVVWRSQAKSGTYTLAQTDNMSVIAASGTLTLNLPAVAGVPGLTVLINSWGGVTTIDPNGAETVNSLVTVDVPLGSFGLLWTDGVNWSFFQWPKPLLVSLQTW